MPEAYEVYDGRFLQERSVTSGAGATTITGPAVPAGKVWTVMSGSYAPSVAETRTVCWFILTRGGNYIAISFPQTILLPPGNWPLLTQGTEIKLFPGEALYINRDVATAGSTINIVFRFIETDLPYYSQVEKLRKVLDQSQRHGSVYRSTGAISTGGSGGGGGHPPDEGGGGEPQPY